MPAAASSVLSSLRIATFGAIPPGLEHPRDGGVLCVRARRHEQVRAAGGASMPTSLFTTMMMPSWVAMGNRIGAMMSRIAEGSTKLPAAKKQQVHHD
jgi:hypothetical protein